MPARSLATLLHGIIDYAGLFPPAGLDMARAVEGFNRARIGEHAWMLGRFVCPASRLREFSQAAAPMMPGTFATSGYREMADAGEPWRVSVLVDGMLDEALDLIDQFNAHHEREENGRASADALEMKVTAAAQIDPAIEKIPEDVFPFFEIPLGADCRGFVAALAGEPVGAKIRTGGLTPEAFPQLAHVAEFIQACAIADVRFKATAGLHHPVRGTFNLTYEPNCPRGVMLGFLNLFLAAALVRAERLPIAKSLEILDNQDPAKFKFADEFASFGGSVIETARLARARESFALSFGSCSFDEPVADLRAIGLL
jgi:hypothetical protein